MVTAIRLPLRSSTLAIPVSGRVTRAVHSGLEYTQTVSLGLPLTLPSRAAAPAVEPKSRLPALRNSSALLEPRLCTQRTSILSGRKASSSHPCCLSTRLTGL